MRQMLLLFNHQLTDAQAQDAKTVLGVEQFVKMPPDIQTLWAQIPADLPELAAYLSPVAEWLQAASTPRDYVLIQGDIGACCLMAQTARQIGLIPVYATTMRNAVEASGPDGVVRVTRRFSHVMFRKYQL